MQTLAQPGIIPKLQVIFQERLFMAIPSQDMLPHYH